MAEVLGTVVGVVSLGLQVCAGVSTYLDGVQCRDEDIEHATRSCKSMDALLQQIKSLQGQLSTSAAANLSAVREAMTSAEVELSNLSDFTGKICAGNSGGSSGTIKERVRDQKSKLLYPFRKDHLHRLNIRLDLANAALQSALLQVQLNLSLSQSHDMQGLRTGLDSLSKGVSHTHLDMQTSFQQIHSNGVALHTTLTKVEKNTGDSSMILAATHENMMLAREEVAEMKMMLTSLLSSSADGRAVLPRLISKPAVLKQVCSIAEIDSEDVTLRHAAHDQGHSPSKGRSFPGFQCTCKPRQEFKRSRKRVGPAFWDHESLTANVHASWCTLARVHAVSNDKWSVGVSTRALRGVLSAAITFSMSATFGAGGFGLSPSFTYYPIHEESPALKVIRTLQHALWYSSRRRPLWNDEDCSSLVGHGLKTLQAIFSARTSSPLDINRNGRNLLGVLSSEARSYSWRGLDNKMLAFLVDMGVPRDRPDDWGRFPLNDYVRRKMSYPVSVTTAVGALEILWPDDNHDITSSLTPRQERPLSTNRAYEEVKKMKFYKKVTAASLKMKKAYEGHLMEAIAQQSITMLTKIMEKASFIQELSSMDPSGGIMLHYLLGWPEGLQTIIERYGYSSIRRYHQSQPEPTLLEYALAWSAEICTGYDLRSCPNDCPCAKAVNVLLEAQREYSLQLNLHGYWMEAMLRASPKARDLVIDELKSRRQGLKQLGFLHLDNRQIERMNLKEDTVLDYYTRDLLEELEAMGVDIPCRFRAEVHVDRKKSHEAASIYHVLGNSQAIEFAPWTHELADSFYAKGFLDIETPDCSGLSPLVQACAARHCRGFVWTWGRPIESWFIQHGATVGRQLPSCVTGYTAAHRVFGLVGSHGIYVKGSDSVALLRDLLELIGTSVSHMEDACECGCSVGGCSPLNCIWKEVLKILGPGPLQFCDKDDRKEAMEFIFERARLMEEAFDMPRHIKHAWLRTCTFEMLPLRHTCCIDGSERCNREEAFEIWQEDKLELDRLELLLSEFERKMEDLDCSLSEFYQSYWMDRMNEVFSQIDGRILTLEEMRDAQRLGVNLVVAQGATRRVDAKAEDSLEFWFHEMDALLEA